MSKFVNFVLYRSSVNPITGDPSKAERLFWVLDLKIDSDADSDAPFHIQIVSSTWSDLEFELMSQDEMLCRILVASFPHAMRGRSTLFDEYSNQYFSALMEVISELPAKR